MPVLTFPPNFGNYTTEEIDNVCGTGANRDYCQYDLEITQSEIFAISTRMALDTMDYITVAYKNATIASCDYLELPYTYVSYTTGFTVGSTVSVTGCYPDYVVNPDVTFPQTYTCKQVADNKPYWDPAPSTLCRCKLQKLSA